MWLPLFGVYALCEGTGNREQGTGMAAGARSYSGGDCVAICGGGCRGGFQSLPQQAKPAVQGVRSHALGRKVDFPENACIVPGKTDEVVLLKETTQTVDAAGGTTSSDPALRPAHLPLNRSLRSLGKAFG